VLAKKACCLPKEYLGPDNPNMSATRPYDDVVPDQNIAVLHAAALATGFYRIHIHLPASHHACHPGEPAPPAFPDITWALQP
jgi:hypothetical protein